MNLQQAQQIISDMNAHKIQWDDNLRAQANNAIDAADPVKQSMKLYQQMQQAQIAANQPAIQTLQSQGTNLSDSYKQLLNSVLTGGTVAENYATKAENTLLGQRGIVDPNSALYGQQMSDALLPVESQYKTLAANVGMGSAQDLNQLASEIAGYQTGNPVANMSAATGFTGNLTSLAQDYSKALLNANTGLAETKIQATVPQSISPGNTVFNPSTLKFLSPNQYGANGQPLGGGGQVAKSYVGAGGGGNSSRKSLSGISKFVKPL